MRCGSGLDQSGNVEHHAWKEHILTGDTDRLEESGLPGPNNRVDDKSTFNAWFKMQEKRTNGKVASASAKNEKEFRRRLDLVASEKRRVEELAKACLVKSLEENRLPDFEECKRIILQWPCVMSWDEATKKDRRGILYPYGSKCRIESFFGMVKDRVHSQPIVSSETRDF